MVGRLLLFGAILLPLLLLVPACGGDRDSGKGAKPPTLSPQDQPPPEPRPAGKSG